MTVTFRDLWLRRERKARAAKFALMKARNQQLWRTPDIEWVEIDTGGLTDRQFFDAAQSTLKSVNAKRNRLRALQF